MSTDEISINQDSDKKEVDTIDSGKFLLLYFLSIGLYGIWWMYKMWRFFREKDSSDIMPAWRAIFGVFFIYSLFEKILNFAKQNTPAVSTYSSALLAATFIILNLLGRLPDPYWLIAFAAGLCFIQPIHAFNSAITTSYRYRAKEPGMSNGQIVIVVVGVLFWLLILFGLFVPVEEEY
jgi:hypothetical protein